MHPQPDRKKFFVLGNFVRGDLPECLSITRVQNTFGDYFSSLKSLPPRSPTTSSVY